MNQLRLVLLVAFVTNVGLACRGEFGDDGLVQRDDTSRYTLVSPDGFTQFFSGPNIANVIGKGHIPGERDRNPYNLIRVPSSKVDEVRAKPSGVLTISLEEPAPFDVDLTVNTFREPGVPTTVHLKPGDPWLSGFAQIWVGKDGTTAGLFEATKWTRHPGGNITIDQYAMGSVPDDQAPKLKYNGPPNTWPELPPSWK